MAEHTVRDGAENRAEKPLSIARTRTVDTLKRTGRWCGIPVAI